MTIVPALGKFPADGGGWSSEGNKWRAYPSCDGSLAPRFFGATFLFPISNQSTDLLNSGHVAERAQTAPKNEIPVSRSDACRCWSGDVGLKIRSRLPSPLRRGTKTADEPHVP
jgi:hypothetical protein